MRGRNLRGEGRFSDLAGAEDGHYRELFQPLKRYDIGVQILSDLLLGEAELVGDLLFYFGLVVFEKPIRPSHQRMERGRGGKYLQS